MRKKRKRPDFSGLFLTFFALFLWFSHGFFVGRAFFDPSFTSRRGSSHGVNYTTARFSFFDLLIVTLSFLFSRH